MDSKIEKQLERLGIILPEISRPSGSYIPVTSFGRLLFVSGQVPRVNGIVKYSGKMGADITLEEAYEGAKICAVNSLAAIKSEIGNLDRVERILKVNGYINSAPDFPYTYKVLNGASDFFLDVFGEKGRHARSAIGVQTLPDCAVVEIEVIVEIKN